MATAESQVLPLEARGYHLALVLAHQHLSQLPAHLRDALSADARNKIYFTTSPEDAHQLRHHLHPTLSQHDLAHLGAYQAAARLITGGAQTRAFTLRTRPLPPPVPGRQEAVRAASRTRYSTPPTARRQSGAQRTAASRLVADPRGVPGQLTASPDHLWWPPQKIGGRYLSAWLAHEDVGELEPPRHPIDVEVALPKEWHEEPMALYPYSDPWVE